MKTDIEDAILWSFAEATPTFKRRGEPIDGAGDFSPSGAAPAEAFLRTIPGYEPTPLVRLDALASLLGIGEIYLKDESHRFGLGAFKSTGGAYAAAAALARHIGIPTDGLTFDRLVEESRGAHGVVLATATDGNHGRGVAWAARMFGCGCVVNMPKGASPRRVDAIAGEGADVAVTDMNYDDCVRMTAEAAAREGWIVVQDTSWEGYEEIPRDIMRGYCTIAAEASRQLAEPPTHIFVQAGVGSFAASIAAYMRELYGERCPRIIVVEASKAACYYRSAAARDGEMRKVGGDLDTIMAGLACGEPSPIAYGILSQCASAYVSCPDCVTARGMRVLASPLRGDPQVVSGESGAVCAGLLTYLGGCGTMSALRVAIGLSERSRVLLFSTEGSTDPESYQSIVWDGAHPS